MKQHDSPAWWLHEVLARLRKQSGVTVRQAYANAFQLPSNDIQSVQKALVEAREVIDLLEVSLREIDGINTELFLNPFPKLREFLSIENLETGWGHSDRFPESSLAQFEFAADALSRVAPETRIPNDDLRRISEEISSLFEDVAASDIPKQLKRTILELLAVIRTATESYRIRGTRAINVAVSTALGELLRHQAEVKSSGKDPSLQRFLKLIELLDSLTTKAAPYAKALEASLPYLLLGSGA